MASIVRLGKGKQPPRAIEFTGLDSKRCRLRIGKVSSTEAKEAKRFVEKLLSARRLDHALSQETQIWLAKIDDTIRDRLAKFGLCRCRSRKPPLGQLITTYLEAKRLEIEPSSVKRIEDSIRHIKQFFDESLTINRITAAMAKDWRTSMLKQGLAEATVRTHSRNAKTLFNYAIERELIKKNPFRSLPSASVAADKDRYITPEETDKLIASSPCLNWQVLIGLTRFSGLRCPKEALSVCWSDIDWDRRRLNLRITKSGKPRDLPIRPEIFELLAEQHGRKDGSPIVDLSRNNLHRKMAQIRDKAGVTPWRDMFQHLRRCCRTQWLNEGLPDHAVSRWMGHGQRVGDEHYTILTDDVFERATKATPGGKSKSGAESGAADHRIGLQMGASSNLTFSVSAKENHVLLDKTLQNMVFTSAPPVGLEPTTNGLTVRRSTN